MGGKESKPKLSEEELKRFDNLSIFHAKEIQDLYESFCKEYPSGIINKNDFIEKHLIKTRFGDYNFWQHLFNLVDTDGSDSITFDEWLMVMSKLFSNQTKNRLYFLFDVFDFDNDGYLSKEELIKVLEFIQRLKPDIDLNINECVEDSFLILDDNDDGKITLREFLQGLSQRRNKFIIDDFDIGETIYQILKDDPVPVVDPRISRSGKF